MLIPGLCSVTFRKKAPREICELASKAGLKSIEWGGDVHATDAQAAKEIASMAQDYGLQCASYGSYFRAGANKLDDFERELETAMALGADNIRIWPGNAPSSGLTGEQRMKIIADMNAAGELAMCAGITVSMEYHGGTLTDTPDSAGHLLTQLGPSNVFFYWQPRWDWDEQSRIGSLLMILSRLTNIHAFHWSHEGGSVTRLPLRTGEMFLHEALSLAAEDGADRHVFLEFVRDDSEQALLEDAAALNEWLDSVQH